MVIPQYKFQCLTVVGARTGGSTKNFKDLKDLYQRRGVLGCLLLPRLRLKKKRGLII